MRRTIRTSRRGRLRLSALAAAAALALSAGPAVSAEARPAPVFPRLQSLYVPMPDGVRLAVDVWLPAGTAAGARLPTVLEADRYWRSRAYTGGITNDPNYSIATPWTSRGYAYVFADLRGTGASFGTVTAELGRAMIADVGSLSDWIAAQPWSDGRVGTTGVSYAGDAAMLSLALRNHHITAAAPISYDFDPYEDLLRPGGILIQPRVAPFATLLSILDDAHGTTCATSAETQQICAGYGLTGASPKPVGGPDGPALLAAARAGHYGNANLIDYALAAPYRDDVVGAQSWPSASTGTERAAIQAGGVPILTCAGWLDAGTANGVLSQFTSLSNTQDDWIGPWSHGQGYLADPFQASRLLTRAEHQQLNDEVYAFFDQHVKDSRPPGGGRLLHYYTLNEGRWRTTTRWPVAGTRTRTLYLAGGHTLAWQSPAPGADRLTLDPTAGTGALDRWNTNLTGQAVVYPDRAAADRKLLSYTSPPLRRATRVTGLGRVSLTVTGDHGAADGALYAYLEDVQPGGHVTYVTEGELALTDRATIPRHDNPAWRKLRTPRTYSRSSATPFPAGERQQVSFDLLPTSVLFRPGDKIRMTIAAASPDSFQLLPASGQATYTIGHGGPAPATLQLPVVG
ncbi:MAG TPA: CocE/NonD family hydrolase [Streptosporangiaceae bacterium]